ncbi:MAG: DNA mismatch repair endonuclease MutL [Vicingaceae bacterium]
MRAPFSKEKKNKSMPDIIQLLPDSVANQIAAGEVVQRPASAVKELLENSIDAGATEVSLIIKNAGKTLIQVIDNGIGMSETDARLCLERHATSKIKKVEDLFDLRTMGFRGEAVPSIAAVSQVEIKTKTTKAELGTQLVLEGSEVKSQEFCQCAEGTQISVKNLFFNIPARRNFLKSNPVETKHIIEEFLRVAMIHPEVVMNMHNDQSEVYRLPKGNFRQRIVNIFGNKYNQRLVPVKESTDIVEVEGFVGKPEFAKKTRGEQYFFVNQRFIKSPYLNHAVQAAFEELLPKDHFPSYFLKMEINPAKIDINIHPTKTEIKFEEERAIYAIIRTAVRQALGRFNVAPSLDFERESTFDLPELKKGEAIRMPNITVNPDFNPFDKEKKQKQGNINFPFKREKESLQKQWEKLYEDNEATTENANHFSKSAQTSFENEENAEKKVMQLHRKYILSHLKSGFILIDQQRAHERILWEKFQQKLAHQQGNSQQLLFPERIEINAEDKSLLEGLKADLENIGFDLSFFSGNEVVINGAPSELGEQSAANLIEQLLEGFKNNQGSPDHKPRMKLLQALAHSMSIKSGKRLENEEMNQLIDELFACEMPYHLPNGKPIVITYALEELDKQFKRS